MRFVFGSDIPAVYWRPIDSFFRRSLAFPCLPQENNFIWRYTETSKHCSLLVSRPNFVFSHTGGINRVYSNSIDFISIINRWNNLPAMPYTLHRWKLLSPKCLACSFVFLEEKKIIINYVLVETNKPTGLCCTWYQTSGLCCHTLTSQVMSKRSWSTQELCGGTAWCGQPYPQQKHLPTLSLNPLRTVSAEGEAGPSHRQALGRDLWTNLS